MKRFVLLTLAALLVSSLAYGQHYGSVDLYGDAGATTCNAVDPGGSAIVPIYVFHTHPTDGTTASQFKIGMGGGASMMYLSMIPVFTTTIGNASTDVSVAYVSCQTASEFLILTVNYLGLGGGSPPCSYLQIQPADGILSGEVEVVDCTPTPFTLKQTFPVGGSLFLNNDGSCTCVDPVEETTWGGIKSLYAD
jgi:hypothetical protein